MKIKHFLAKRRYKVDRVSRRDFLRKAADFQVPQAAEISKRGIQWAAESKYTTTPDLIQPVYKL